MRTILKGFSFIVAIAIFVKSQNDCNIFARNLHLIHLPSWRRYSPRAWHTMTYQVSTQNAMLKGRHWSSVTLGRYRPPVFISTIRKLWCPICNTISLGCKESVINYREVGMGCGGGYKMGKSVVRTFNPPPPPPRHTHILFVKENLKLESPPPQPSPFVAPTPTSPYCMVSPL